MLLYFGSLPMMPIAQVGAALFTAPIWVLIFAAVLFGRPIGPRRLVAVGLGFAGVLVMLRPDPANLSLVTLMPVAAGALYGLANLLTREWCAEEPVGALLAGFFGAMGLAGALALALLAVAPLPVQWVRGSAVPDRGLGAADRPLPVLDLRRRRPGRCWRSGWSRRATSRARRAFSRCSSISS